MERSQSKFGISKSLWSSSLCEANGLPRLQSWVKNLLLVFFLVMFQIVIAYRFFNIEDNIVIEMDIAIFYENIYPFDSKNSGVQGIEQIFLSLPSSSTFTLEIKKFDDFELRRSKTAKVATTQTVVICDHTNPLVGEPLLQLKPK